MTVEIHILQSSPPDEPSNKWNSACFSFDPELYYSVEHEDLSMKLKKGEGHEPKTFHDGDGRCGDPEMIAPDDGSTLILYSDSHYPDGSGVKRKTILCRKSTVE